MISQRQNKTGFSPHLSDTRKKVLSGSKKSAVFSQVPSSSFAVQFLAHVDQDQQITGSSLAFKVESEQRNFTLQIKDVHIIITNVRLDKEQNGKHYSTFCFVLVAMQSFNTFVQFLRKGLCISLCLPGKGCQKDVSHEP